MKEIYPHQATDGHIRIKEGHIPTLAAARLQRWALLLSTYDYEIQFKPTESHSNADGLSRLPLPVLDSDNGAEAVSLFNVSQVQSLPVTFQQVQQATKRDPVLSKLLRYVRQGWPTQIPDEPMILQFRKHQVRGVLLHFCQ